MSNQKRSILYEFPKVQESKKVETINGSKIMIKYLNEYQVMEAYFQVLNWGKYALKEFKVWQIDQIKKYAERKLISIPERIEDYEKMKLNLSEVNLLTFQGQEKDNRSDNRKMFEINKTIFKLSNDLSNAYLVLNYIRDFNVELIKEDSKRPLI